ncbi:MAG: preprotein translocase subunit SecA [Candidatus Roizmanbacteria bacterium]
MLQAFRKLFDFNARELDRLKKKVQSINALEDKARSLADDEFSKETMRLKKQLQNDKTTTDEVLPWAFALVREASRRTLGIRHFDVQLLAGIALHEGRIDEQKTGEGKTLTATTALYLNALFGKGAHLVTVNDYLARRDAGWMGQVFHFLGLSTSAIIGDNSYIFDINFSDSDAFDLRLSHLRSISRKEAYDADITYGINSEFGFDYLRDNMVQAPEDLVQRGFYYAIIDEADSVLIDEARTPHIISAPYEQDTSKYYEYAKIVRQLDSDVDYVIDEKLRTANITEAGVQKIEKIIGVDNLYEKDFDTVFHVEAALKAETLYTKDKDYIVQGGEVVIVDEFTGRLLQGRRFSEGLHQAIEAKERVTIQKESRTLATVSLQNYFRMYKKLAGMTGTASTEAEEFNKIYKTDVLTVPTHNPMIRKDQADNIYKTEKGKFEAVASIIAEQHKLGRPMLVGTTSIQKNESLSQLLHKKGVPHELLNAKNHEREAQIISNAGKKGAVTVATNMAGRGVDIILGGEPPTDRESKAQQEWQKHHDEIIKLGGLFVIGTERHESRRIDNQLRGRAGRQGDPGETQFFVSLEDDLMRIFGGEQISKLMTIFNFPEDQPLSHPMVSKAIEQAQVKVEGFNFDIRKHLVDFDDVLNKQREIVYSLRRKILDVSGRDPAEFQDTIFEITDEVVARLTSGIATIKDDMSDEELDVITKDITVLVPISSEEIKDSVHKRGIEHLSDLLCEKVELIVDTKEARIGQEIWFNIVRMIVVSTMDQFWTQHLTAIEDLREGINLRGYAQLDPLVEYKNEAFRMFENLIADMYYEIARRIIRVEINEESREEIITPHKEVQDVIYKSASSIDPFKQPTARVEHKVATGRKGNSSITIEDAEEAPFIPVEQTDGGFKVIPPGTPAQKVGRNDPCWCGSGKKYKKCHWPN